MVSHGEVKFTSAGESRAVRSRLSKSAFEYSAISEEDARWVGRAGVFRARFDGAR